MMRLFTRSTSFLALLLVCCLPLSAQTLVESPDVPGMMIPEGFRLYQGVGELTFPSNLAIADDGRIWVAESGYSPDSPPVVKQITLGDGVTPGSATVILTPGMLPFNAALPPFTDVNYHNGMVWLGHRTMGANGFPVGAYSRFDPADPAGSFEIVLTNLPSTGDHANNMIVFGADGRAYFGQGSSTNSGVVGADNGWVGMAPNFAELAPVDLTFRPNGFEARAPSGPDPDANAVTAAYRPFDSGAETTEYTVPAVTPANPYDGIIAGTGTVYSFDPAADNPASTLRLEAWGLRNPYGLTFDATNPNRLYISNNGSDIRGQAGDPNDPLDPETFNIMGNRPISGDHDDLFVIETGGTAEFFGWPDFMHDPATKQALSIGDDRFCDSPALDEDDCPEPLFADSFRDTLTVTDLFADMGPYVSTTGLSPSPSDSFGFVGNVFATKSGSFSPQTGAFEFTGYSVVRVDETTGETSDFIVNMGSTAEELFVPTKLNKPLAIEFMDDRMLIVDLGVVEPGIDLFQTATGKVWVLERQSTTSTNELFSRYGARLSHVFPNPAGHRARLNLDLSLPLSDAQVDIIDFGGRTLRNVYTGSLPAGENRFDLELGGLPQGSYIVRVMTSEGLLTRRFVKN